MGRFVHYRIRDRPIAEVDSDDDDDHFNTCDWDQRPIVSRNNDEMADTFCGTRLQIVQQIQSWNARLLILCNTDKEEDELTVVWLAEAISVYSTVVSYMTTGQHAEIRYG